MSAASASGTWLYYFGEHQPRRHEEHPPAISVELPGRPYLALRVRRA